MPRFVVLHHETPPGYPRPSHYDLMLEQGQSLRTWALASLPELGQEEVVAEELAPHRLAYLDYEGEVSTGRGQVKRVAAGEYALLEDTTDRFHIRFDRFDNPQLASEWILTRQPDQPSMWCLTTRT
jgi:hypothetical protein